MPDEGDIEYDVYMEAVCRVCGIKLIKAGGSDQWKHMPPYHPAEPVSKRMPYLNRGT